MNPKVTFLFEKDLAVKMTAIRTTEDLRQYKRTFYLFVEQILAFTSSTHLVKEVKSVSPYFKRIT